MSSRGKRKKDMKEVKCMACCYINGEDKRTLDRMKQSFKENQEKGIRIELMESY